MNRVMNLCITAGIALSGPVFALTDEERIELSSTCDDVQVYSKRTGPSSNQSATEESDEASKPARSSEEDDRR